MNRYRNRDWMGLRSGHGDLAVSTISRFPAYIVQLNFLHLYQGTDNRRVCLELQTPNKWRNNCTQLISLEQLLFTVLNYSNIQRLTGKGERQLITLHVKVFGYVIWKSDTRGSVVSCILG